MTETEKKTVLVVDDEENVRIFLKTVLKKAGFNVQTASNGLEALDIVKADPPDVISLDLIMPKKSGAKFFHEIRKDKKLQKIPVVLVSAHTKDDLGKQDFDDIMSGKAVQVAESYLEKPVKAEVYVDSIKRALGMEHIKTLVTPKSMESPSKTVKDEIKTLIDNADPAKLQQILDVIKKKK
ncbi:MAG: response regulator [Thermodesulfobacteriota bacterium]|nr:response regulator [Thermodesulfobacteriota bacterium]